MKNEARLSDVIAPIVKQLRHGRKRGRRALRDGADQRIPDRFDLDFSWRYDLA